MYDLIKQSRTGFTERMQQNPLFSQNDNENKNYIKGSTTSSMISASYKTSKIENDENQINVSKYI